MRTRKTWEKEIKMDAFSQEKFIGEFRNEHGELFVLTQLVGYPCIMITGDELDWETGWYYDAKNKQAVQKFDLADNEIEQINKIIKK